jgi:carbonic anhydrase
MRTLDDLFENNRVWAERITARDPKFFELLSRQQAPRYLWIGCSDSRVPANEIVGLLPGEMFVHRNVANVVVHTDLNCLSVLQYAVDALRVEHVIVCGHYGCGGVRAAWQGEPLGLIDNWLRHVQDVAAQHLPALEVISPLERRLDRLCELNVLAQARHVCRTTIVQDAWANRQSLTIHAFVYSLKDGRLRDLGFNVAAGDEVAAAFERAIEKPSVAPTP